MTEMHNPETGEILEPLAPNPPAKKTGPGKTANGKAKVKPDESKREKFVRLVDPRMNKALAAIRRIGNLGGTNAKHYEFDDDDIGKIVQALAKEVAALEKTMERGKPAAPSFSILDD
jgi:hypothetical protein